MTSRRHALLHAATIAVVAFSLLAGASPLPHFTAPRQRASLPRASLSRHDRLRSARVAPGPITDEVLQRQAGEGYNAAMLTDLSGWNAAARRWERKDEATIAQQLALVRQYDFSVFVEIPAVVVVPSGVPGGPNELVQLSDAELRERIDLWRRFSREEIVGVFFVMDDSFLLGIKAADLERWSAISHETAPDLPVLGLAGEYALTLTPQERALLWAPGAYDGLLLLNYPYNLGAVWGHPLDHQKSADPDGALAAYESAYVTALRDALLKDLRPDQIIVPVIQTFFYSGEGPGSVPRARDIQIQSRLLHAAVQQILGQPDNFAMGYYYAGRDGQPYPFAVPLGIYSVPSWPETVAGENALLEAAFAASLSPGSRRRAGRH